MLNLMELRDGKLAGQQPVGASVNFSPEFNAPEPNLPLLRRLAESGGGKLLELPPDVFTSAEPLAAGLNPFLHDRRDTFQPRDWWEWLLRMALLLFVLDVALRRIHLEREQLEKAWAAVRRTVLFWKGVPRAAEADESLAALLTRRDHVRSTKTAASEARPELFQPVTPVSMSDQPGAHEPGLGRIDPQSLQETQPKPADQPQTTADRLLAAKKRARRKLE
jgi:hypothetical protein